MALLRIGSRGSQLALWQANHIASLLRERGHEVEIRIIQTTGDKVTEVALAQVGTKGMFTKEIEEALAVGDVDLAVHSLKDLPTELPAGFDLAAVTEREDPRDGFVSVTYESLKALPAGARVGTSSLRRQAQLKAMRPDVEIATLRGNVDTRLRKLRAGEYDAVVLAVAGLNRLGLRSELRHIFSPEEMCPAAGQGALAVEVRRGDMQTRTAVESLDSPAARSSTECERAVLSTLGGGCQVPIGAFAQVREQELQVTAIVAAPDGQTVLRESATGKEPGPLGKRVGEALLQKGAAAILEQVYGKPAPAPQQP